MKALKIAIAALYAWFPATRLHENYHISIALNLRQGG